MMGFCTADITMQTINDKPNDVHAPPDAVVALLQARQVVFFTGAGMSAESGIATFRDVQTGLWANFKPEHLASPEGWKADRERVWAWYEWRRSLVQRAQPNAGHLAIASMASSRQVTVITQNVDDLHERGGSVGVLHLHGSLFKPRCANCGHPSSWKAEPLATEAGGLAERSPPPRCTRCLGYVRPGVVWFGEMLPQNVWASAEEAVQACDMLVVVGTSGVVFPAAGLVAQAVSAGKFVLEINPEASGSGTTSRLKWRVTAAIGLPVLASLLQHRQL